MYLAQDTDVSWPQLIGLVLFATVISAVGLVLLCGAALIMPACRVPKPELYVADEPSQVSGQDYD